MSTFAIYSDVTDFTQLAAMSIDTAALIGLNTTLYAAATSGGTALSLADKTNAPSPTSAAPAALWVLDGLNSEKVSVSGISGASAPYTATLVSGTTLAASHAQYVNVASAAATPVGSLADVLVRAARWVDNICKQGPDGSTDRTLYAVSRTETLWGPSSRASFDRDGLLVLRPYHWPVSAVTSVTLQMGPQPASTIDTTYLYYEAGARRIVLPQPAVVGAAPIVSTAVGRAWPRNVSFSVTLTYTGGPITGTTLSSVPDDIRQATQLVAAHILATRRNPLGAAMLRQGDVTIEARLRGDTSGKSLLLMDAERLLEPYTAKPGL